MPALNVNFSDDELAVVRGVAAEEGVSMRAWCRRAILDRAHDRDGQVRAVVEEVAERSATLNRYLR